MMLDIASGHFPTFPINVKAANLWTNLLQTLFCASLFFVCIIPDFLLYAHNATLCILQLPTFVGILSTVVHSRLNPDIFYVTVKDLLSIVSCNLLSVSVNLSIENKDLYNMFNAFYCYEILLLWLITNDFALHIYIYI